MSKTEDIARVCHEVNRAYCEALGDMSQPSWLEAPDWQKESALDGVTMRLENPGAGPELSHEAWSLHKIKTGWKYGPEKDPQKKEHPCLVPFESLPVEQQAKDFLFATIVRELDRIL